MLTLQNTVKNFPQKIINILYKTEALEMKANFATIYSPQNNSALLFKQIYILPVFLNGNSLKFTT